MFLNHDKFQLFVTKNIKVHIRKQNSLLLSVYLPRTVMEALGQHHFQSHSENCGIMAHIVTILEHSGPLD